jgi:hypothetical protein
MTIFFKNKQRSVRVLPVSGSSTSALILVDTTSNMSSILVGQRLYTPFTLNILKATLSHPDEYVQKAKKRFWDERFTMGMQRAQKTHELVSSQLTLLVEWHDQSAVLLIKNPFTLNILKATLSHPDEYVQKAKKRFWDERFLLAKEWHDQSAVLLIKNARPKNVF